MAYNVGSERELYEDWKPLLEGQQDALVTVDAELLDQEEMIEQTNLGRGVAVIQPGQNVWPVYRKHSPHADC